MADGKPGRRPLPVATVEHVQRLLVEGQTERSIARRLGVSRRTVGRIHAGVHRAPCESTTALEPGEVQLAQAETCPVCRQPILVKPCRICAARAQREAARLERARRILGRIRDTIAHNKTRRGAPRYQRVPFPRQPNAEQLELDLAPDDQARLDEVRRANGLN